MKKLAIILPTLLVLALFLSPRSAAAAVRLSGDLLEVTPSAPSAHSEVSLRITDAVLQPAGSSVSWFVNGIEMTEHHNKANLTLTTGAAGQTTEVEARLASPTGSEQRATATITPVRVDLVVGAESSTPDFYAGRALPGKEGQISVLALVFADTTGPYFYRWTVNGRELTTEVGSSGNQIIIKPSFAYEMNVYVEVYDQSSTLIAQTETVIPLKEPEIHFYEKSSLHSLIPTVLRAPYHFLSDEVILRAEPYFFSGAATGYDITWKIDNETVSGDEDPLELGLMKTQETGQARIGVGIINTNNYLETARAELLLQY